MKVVILGANGQLGRALVAAAPADIVAQALSRADCDLADEPALVAAIRREAADVVINAAGYTQVDEAESRPDEAERINGIAPGIIASAARAAGGRTVHISSDFVFDGRKSTPYRPDDTPAPLSVYGRTKWRGEQTVTAADPDALIVRTAWLYDAGEGNFVAAIIRLARQRNSLTIVDDQVGTPTATFSLAAALWTMIRADIRGIYHYTDSGVASWYDFAVAIEEEARTFGLLDHQLRIEPISTAQYPTLAARPPYSVLDKSATWALLGWKAPHWRARLRDILRVRKDRG